MIDFQGTGGKLKALADRLTAPRAAALDYLDAAVSTRAPAATAVSNAIWTDALAAALAGIARLERAEVLSVSGSTGAGAGVKAIDITVPAVNTAKAVAFVSGGFIAGSTPLQGAASFTSATNLRIEYVDPTGATSYEFSVVVINFL